MVRKLTTCLAAAAIVAATAACEPVLLTPTAKPDQAPATTVIEGDSITLQYALSGGGADFPDAWMHAGNGWAMTACLPDGCTTPLDDIRARTEAGQADRVVILLGVNDAVGGFSQTEANGWTTALFAPADDACVVLVKPYVGPAAPPDIIGGVGQVNAWVDEWAPLRPNTVVVAWEPYAKRDGVLWFDDVHLAPIDPADFAHVTDEARAARRDVIADGLAQCPA